MFVFQSLKDETPLAFSILGEGDTLSCAVRWDGGAAELLFARGGRWHAPMGSAFAALRPPSGALCPALSLHKDCRLQINFGERPVGPATPLLIYKGVPSSPSKYYKAIPSSPSVSSLSQIPAIVSIARGTQRLNCSMRILHEAAH